MSDFSRQKLKNVSAAKAKRTMYAPIPPIKRPAHQPPLIVALIELLK